MPLRTTSPLASLVALLSLVSCQTGGFNRTDADGDRQLNFDEFSATPVGQASPDSGAAFIAADADRDGLLSSSEFELYASSHGLR